MSGEPKSRSRKRKRRSQSSEDVDESGIGTKQDRPVFDGPEPALYFDAIAPDRLDEDAIKVLRRLTRNGFEAYLVGGGVRDLVLNRDPKDFDIATSAKPQEVRRLFRNCRIIGKRFRLAHVLFGAGKIIEVATFRKDPTQRFDVLPGNPLPSAAKGNPVRIVPCPPADTDDADLLIRNDNIFGLPHEDAIRRDFTINGLFYDHARGCVIDFVGGMPDLHDGVVRMIGDPVVRFREDPVRILRAVKFSARLDLGIDPNVFDAMIACRRELSRAARPRLLEEILRYMRGGAAHRSLYLAWDMGILAELMPEVSCYLDDQAPDLELTWARLAAIDRRRADGESPLDAVMLSALLLGPIEDALDGVRDRAGAFERFVGPIVQRINLPRRTKDRIRGIIGSQRRLRSGRLGSLPRREFFSDAVELHLIDCEARGQEAPDWASRTFEKQEEGQRKPRRRRRRRVR